MSQVTEEYPVVGPTCVSVNVANLVPEFPSTTVTLLIEMPMSSFTMVPTALSPALMTSPGAVVVMMTPNVSSASTVVSPMTSTEKVLLVSATPNS